MQASRVTTPKTTAATRQKTHLLDLPFDVLLRIFRQLEGPHLTYATTCSTICQVVTHLGLPSVFMSLPSLQALASAGNNAPFSTRLKHLMRQAKTVTIAPQSGAAAGATSGNRGKTTVEAVFVPLELYLPMWDGSAAIEQLVSGRRLQHLTASLDATLDDLDEAADLTNAMQSLMEILIDGAASLVSLSIETGADCTTWFYCKDVSFSAMERLILLNCDRVVSTGIIYYIASHAPQLSHLEVTSNDSAVLHAVLLLCRACGMSLETLILDASQRNGHAEKIEWNMDTSLELAASLPKLARLHVINCKIDLTALQSLESLVELRTYRSYTCQDLSQALANANWLPNLRYLGCSIDMHYDVDMHEVHQICSARGITLI